MIDADRQSMFSKHWFVALAPLVIASNALVVSIGPIDRVVEFGVLFDLIVLVPALYFLCYRSQMNRPFVKVLGLACLGVWMATKMIPEPDRMALTYLEPLRFVGLIVLVIVEFAVVRMIYRSLSAGDRSDTVAKQITTDADVPDWVARLLVWEAGLWRKLFGFLRRLVGRERDDD